MWATNRIILALMLVACGVSAQEYNASPGRPRTVPAWAHTEGLQTNATELGRFLDLAANEPYATDYDSVIGHADTARTAWPYDIQAGAWEDDGDYCEPVGEDLVLNEFRMELAATDILAMAIAGTLGDETAANFAAAKTRILEFAATEDFEIALLSGANQCILDLGEAAFHVFEAAWLLESAGYVSWTNANRITLAAWAANEVFPILSWGIDNRKSNWGIVTFGSAIAAAAYAQGGHANLTKWNASSVTPAAYISGAGTPLTKWLSDSNGDELDSECQDGGFDFGLQSYGGLPDDLRRPSDVGTADCEITAMSSHSTDAACSAAANCNQSGGHFYMQKSLNNLVRVAESLRRLSGPDVFAYDSHVGGDLDIISAAKFATNGDYQTGYIQDTTQGFRYVAGSYYRDDGLLGARDDGNVSVRGGRDYAYTRITHAPGVAHPGYEWELGDLSSYSSRFDVDWDHSQWANSYDTEAELNALGWTTVNISNNPCTDLYSNDGPGDTQTSGSPDGRCDSNDNTYDITCAHGGSGSNEDDLAIAAVFADNCDTDPDGGGSSPNVCNNVFKIADSCTLDVTATATAYGSDYSHRVAPAIQLRGSNWALMGTDQAGSSISVNNVMTNTQDGWGPAIANSGYDEEYGGQSAAATYTWSGGDTKGTTTLSISGSCAGIVHEGTDDGDGLNESSILRVVGQDADGGGLWFQTRVAGVTGSGPCTVDIVDPLPLNFASRTQIDRMSSTDRTEYNLFVNMTVKSPYMEPGYCTAEALAAPPTPPGQACAVLVRMYGFNNLLFDKVTLGPGSIPYTVRRGYQQVTRHSDLGPQRHGQRRPNNNNFMTAEGVSLISHYNNVNHEGQIRISVTANAMMAAYFGYNFTVDQTVPNANDDATSGNYCGNPSGGTYPSSGGGPERSVFVRHDGEFSGNTPTGIGHYLFEANDFKCYYFDQGFSNPLRRYATMYRNRFLGSNQTIDIDVGAGSNYQNWVANRAGDWAISSGALVNGLGLYNVDPGGTFTAPTATGITWPTVGTGRNIVDADEHDDYATTDLPPSLGLRTDLPPSWWCEESGPWDGSWSFGYGDGGDNGGVPRKLPAQIRYEGGACTTPDQTADYGSAN